MMARILFLFAILSLFSACDLRSERDVPPRPEQMIGRHDFVSIHAQLQLLEAAHRPRPPWQSEQLRWLAELDPLRDGATTVTSDTDKKRCGEQ